MYMYIYIYIYISGLCLSPKCLMIDEHRYPIPRPLDALAVTCDIVGKGFSSG